ncbi:Retrovirus-related Pol polyprotein from transposon TNT 1-94 [Trichinella patagoniensis]|uniref:Retrovirus-related Pol polyprotein from transposon TNT 1-94 n=1 Tax=Trichinella patagoniensis TaxID=990121 RepID=A0A0V0ZQ18_9BILA|nr:Retrovirus-related Pol polyprotein from transposon TNT 1-94 [Trichinella patagoniensis]
MRDHGILGDSHLCTGACGGEALNCWHRSHKKSDKNLAANTYFAASCLLIQKETDGDKDWFLDSGATTHLTHRDDWMEEYNGRTTHTVAIANGTNITTKGCGVMKIPLATEKTMVAYDVRHAPELALNLLSVSRIAAQKKTLIFDENGCRIVDLAVEVPRQHILGTATQYNGLYRLNRCDHWAMAVQDVPDLWHRRLGHLSRGSMKLLQDGQATGIPSDAITKTDCVTCLKEKQCRLPFPKSATKRSEEVLELVHSDICGPMQVASVGGARYFLSFIDDFSRKSFVYFLKHENEALPKFKDFIAMVDRQTSKRVKCLRTDNGREYVNNMFAEFLVRKGIRHERTIPETPQQNGVAERMNQTLVEKARTMLIDANLSPDLWAEAVGTANYLRNRCPTKALRKMTPEEAWSGRKPNFAHLKVFGCLAMVHVTSGQRKKWDPKSEERIFVGYCETSKGYRTVDCKTKKMYVTRDVKFLESRFPCTQASKEESTNSLMNPDVGEEAVIVWTSQDSGATEMDPNPSVPPKAHWCLGVRIVQDVENGTLSIDQEQYIEELLHRFRMSDCKGVKTPLDPNQVLSKAMMPRSDKEIKQMHAVPYREAVGCLVYTENALTMYSDADWGNDRDDRQSISGCVVCHSGAAIACQAAQESAWLRSLQSELEKETSKPTLLCNDSGAVSISIESEIEMRQIPSADNAVDMFTKTMTPSSPAACVKLTGMAA